MCQADSRVDQIDGLDTGLENGTWSSSIANASATNSRRLSRAAAGRISRRSTIAVEYVSRLIYEVAVADHVDHMNARMSFRFAPLCGVT